MAVLLGLLVFVVLLELGLRGAGRIAAVQRDGLGSADLTVHCVGDSFTYGLGAPPESSYPAQLEDLLAAEAGVMQVEAVNLGRPAATSVFARKEVERVLADGRPDAIVVLTGGNRVFFDHQDGAAGPLRPPSLLSPRVLRLLPMLRWDLRGERLRRLAGERSQGAGFASVLERLASPDVDPPVPCSAAVQSRCDRGAFLYELEWTRAAQRAYSGATQAEPACACGHRGAVKAAATLGDSEALRSAIMDWQRALPQQRQPYDLWASFLVETGRLEESRDWFDAHQERIPPELDVKGWLAEVQLRLGELDTAVALHEELALHQHGACKGRLGLARIAAVRGDSEGLGVQLEQLLAQPDQSCARSGQILGLACIAGWSQRITGILRAHVRRDPQSWVTFVMAASPCLPSGDLYEVRTILADMGIAVDDIEAVLGGLQHAGQLWERGAAPVRGDLEAMCRMAGDAGVPLVLVTYPYPNPVNVVIRELAEQPGVGLADAEAAFRILEAQGEPRSRYFVGDGDDPVLRNDHCSAAGYAVVAELVRQALADQGVLGAEGAGQ